MPIAPRLSAVKPQRIVVVGAGAVGMACALTLRRDGHDVTVLDPRPPGEGASSGNAGIIAHCAIDPIGMPGIVSRVPRMLLDPMGPLTIRWRYLPRLAPWLIHLVAASRPARVERIAHALASLLRNAVEAWGQLVEGTEGARYLVPRGWIYAFETDAAFAAIQPAIDLRRRHGFRVEVLDAGELHDLEPAAAQIFRHATYLPDSAFAMDPLRLVRALADAFVAAGGSVRRERVTSFHRSDAPTHDVVTESARYPCDCVIIAAGAWSGALAAQLGSRVPLDTERGYHVMLATPPRAPRHPLSSGEHRFVIAPMQDGIRITGSIEFAGLDAPADFTRIRRLARHASRMVPQLDATIRSEWLGFRPSMPDSLPVIGRAPAWPTAFFAFGHGHLGLTAAATTAHVIADLVADRETAIDVAPFRPDRFRF